jgi:transposase
MGGRTISQETKQKIISEMTLGTSTPKSIARILHVTYSSAMRIYKTYVDTGQINRPPRGGYKSKKLTEIQLSSLLEWVTEENVLTLSELKRKIFDEFTIDVSERTIATYIQGFHFSFKRISVISEVSLSDDLFERRKVFARDLLRLNNNKRK